MLLLFQCFESPGLVEGGGGGRVNLIMKCTRRLKNCRQNWRQKHFELRIVKYTTILLFVLVLLPVLCSSFLLNRALSFVLR